MEDKKSILTLRIETRNPIEITDFVGAFTSLEEEFLRFIRQENPENIDEAKIFVTEIRKGSIEADLTPLLLLAAPFIDFAEKALVIEAFIKVWGNRIGDLINGKKNEKTPSKQELETFTNAVAAIANDPDASSTLEFAVYEDGQRKVKAGFKFNSTEARSAKQTIEEYYKEINKSESKNFYRVLLVFTRTDIGDVRVGRKSGERVKIEEISDRPLALIYASDLAEQRIKHEIRDADDNVYKKGFVVDVNVKTNNGRPVAYAVIEVHEIIDLPEDDE